MVVVVVVAAAVGVGLRGRLRLRMKPGIRDRTFRASGSGVQVYGFRL